MRKVLVELLGGMVFAATTAIVGCNSATNPAESGTGGSSSNGGAVGTGGSSSNGGAVSAGGSSTNVNGGSSSSGGSSGGDSVTTLSSAKALNSLTAAEATQLCSDTYAYFERAITKATACKWKGLYFATQSSAPTEEKLQSNCSSKEDPCLAESSSPWSNQTCSDIPTDCTKTLAEYQACIKEQSTWLAQKVGELPGCAAFTMASSGPVWDIVGAILPASCEFCAGYAAPEPRQF
jgi:hypothetical protein